MLWVSEREDAIVLTVRLVHVHNMLTLMELLSPVIINIPYHPPTSHHDCDSGVISTKTPSIWMKLSGCWIPVKRMT